MDLATSLKRKRGTSEPHLDEEYIEVFSGSNFKVYKPEVISVYDVNLKYVVNIRSIRPYLSDKERKSTYISKWRLVEIYNYINFAKTNEIEKSKTNKKQLQK